MSSYQRMRGFGRPSVMPPVIKWLLIINIGIWALQYFFLSGSINYFISKYFALQPIIFSYNDFGNFMPWQLITYQFLHNLSGPSFFSAVMHVGFNMFALWMFGIELEGMWGSKKFLIYYLLSGIGAGILHLLISPMFSIPLPAIGASGAVYGILLAFGLTFPNRPIFLFPFFIPIPAKIFVIIFAGIELISGLSGADGVAHFAHLGGALTGFLLIKFGDRLNIYGFFDRFFKSGSSYSTPYQQKVEEPSVYRVNWYKKESAEDTRHESSHSGPLHINGEEITQAKIDEILDKISESGYQNLSEQEKKILYELSQKLK